MNEDIKERILNFFYQIKRSSKEEIENQSLILRKLLYDLSLNKNKNIELINVLYKIIGYTRDIIDGLGEYSHSYMQILVWYDYYPKMAMYALDKFVFLENKSQHPYGSWKDIKYFCQYCNEKGLNYNHNLIQFALNLMNKQIFIDNLPNKIIKNKSLAAKWVPREKSKSKGWIFEKLAFLYFSNYFNNVKSLESRNKAELKCKMNYRKIISKLNKEIDTVQIKQCSGEWGLIDFSKTTPLTIFNQSKCFLNINNTENILIKDRIKCSENFKEYINTNGEIKSTNIELNRLVKKAKNIQNNVEIDLLNLLWKNKVLSLKRLLSLNTLNPLNPIIPILDLSNFVKDNYKDFAIGLSCKIAENSIIGKRVLSFTDVPIWNNLDNCNNLIEMVEVIEKGSKDNKNNKDKKGSLYNALKLILDSIVECGLTIEEVKGLTLLIFTSNESVSSIKEIYKESLIKNIDLMFEEKGLKRPEILFWNLGSPELLSCICDEERVSVMSGFNPPHPRTPLLVPQSPAPLQPFLKVLLNPRYNILDVKYIMEDT